MFAKEHRAEKVSLLGIPSARQAFIEILIEMQTSPNNRRMGAMELARTVAEVRYLRKPIGEIIDMPVLKMMSIEKWNMLREKAESDKTKAANPWIRQREVSASVRSEMILRILPKIRSHVIRKFAQRGLDVEQLVNEGVIGVARAMEKYDPERGKKFIDYAMTWVDARIFDAFEKSAPVTLSSSLAALRSKIKACRERLTVSLGRPPEDDEIALELNITSETYRRAYVRVDSLDSVVSGEEGDGLTLGETLESDDEFACEYDELLAAKHIATMLESLSGHERDVTLFRLPPSGLEFSNIVELPVNQAMEEMKLVALESVELALRHESAKAKRV